MSEQGEIFEPIPQNVSAGTEHVTCILGARTRYWEYGKLDGTPLVLVHGFRGDHHGLELITHYLAQFRVIVPDLPGFGKSDALPGIQHHLSTYAAWLDEFLHYVVKQETIYLVGHSFGSIVCSYFAANRPERIRRLALINPISQPALEGNQKVLSRLADFYYSAGEKLPAPLGFSLLRSSIVTMLSSKFMAKNKDKKLQRYIDGQHIAYFGNFTSRRALLEAYRTSVSETAARYAPSILIPTLMIVAEKDDLGTLETQHSMAQSIPHCTLKIIPRVGHLIHYETPRRAAHLISDFFEGNSCDYS